MSNKPIERDGKPIEHIGPQYIDEKIHTVRGIDVKAGFRGLANIIFAVIITVVLLRVMVAGVDASNIDYMQLPKEILQELSSATNANSGLNVGDVVIEIAHDIDIQSSALQESAGLESVIDGFQFFFVMVGDLGKLVGACLLNALRLIGAVFRLFGRVIE